MRIIISAVLAAIVAFLLYVLFLNIQEPIKFQNVKTEKGQVVVDKLDNIRTAQEIYKTITGEYAATFDTLSYVLTNDSIPFIKQEIIPDKPGEFKKIVTYSSAIDSINALDINLDELRYVPFTDNSKEFDIAADTLTYQQTLVNVVQVGTRWKTFMGDYANPKYARYDKKYDPNALIKFGDMNAPSTAGNW